MGFCLQVCGRKDRKDREDSCGNSALYSVVLFISRDNYDEFFYFSLCLLCDALGIKYNRFVRTINACYSFPVISLCLILYYIHYFSFSLRAMRRMSYLKYLWEAVRASGWIAGRPKNCKKMHQ